MGNGDSELHHVAARARAEWRDEQEQATADAVIVRRHAQDFRSRLRAAMTRGDRVALHAGAVRVTGLIIEVDDDLVSLRDAFGDRVDVRLDPVPELVLRVTEVAAGAGCTPPLPSGGFRGRMLDAEASGARYWVCTRGEPAPMEGSIAVGADHLDVVDADGRATTVALPLVVYVELAR